MVVVQGELKKNAGGMKEEEGGSCGVVQHVVGGGGDVGDGLKGDEIRAKEKERAAKDKHSPQLPTTNREVEEVIILFYSQNPTRFLGNTVPESYY